MTDTVIITAEDFAKVREAYPLHQKIRKPGVLDVLGRLLRERRACRRTAAGTNGVHYCLSYH